MAALPIYTLLYSRSWWSCWDRPAGIASSRPSATRSRCRRSARTCATRSWSTGFSDTRPKPIYRRPSAATRRPPGSTPSRWCPAPPRTRSRYVCPPGSTLRICTRTRTAIRQTFSRISDTCKSGGGGKGRLIGGAPGTNQQLSPSNIHTIEC